MALPLHFTTAGEGWLLELADGGGLALELLPPVLEAGGQSWSLGLGDALRAPATDRLGAGERLTGTATGGPVGLEVRFELMLYRDRPAAALTCYLTNRSAAPLELGTLRALHGCVMLPGAGAALVYVNSGCQGFSGVVPAGPEPQGSAFVTAIHAPGRATFTAGVLSYARAEVGFTTTVHGANAHCSADCRYSGWVLAPGETLAGETLWLSFEPDPLAALEEYGDAVARWLNLRVSPDRGGLWNLYYTYSKRDVHEVDAEDIRAGAQRLAETLGPYGVRYIDWGCWQRGHAFMEDRPWEAPYPEMMHVRWMISGLLGGFVSIAGDLLQMAEEEWRWFTLLLPSYGRVARPLDLFTSPLPSLLDLSVSTAWDAWHVVGVINWTDEPRECTLEFARLMPAPSGPQRVYEFWERQDLGGHVERLPLTLPPRSARLLRIAPERPHPWLLTSEMHLTQGGVEVSDLRWSRERSTLRGVCRRPRTAHGTLRVTVPAGWEIVEFLVRRAPLTIEAVPGSAAVRVEFPDDDPLVWEARYRKLGLGARGPGAAASRPGAAGLRLPLRFPRPEGG
jgi:hypothetical protein